VSNDVSNDFTVSGLTDGESDEIIRALEAGNLLNSVMPEPDWASIPLDPSELPPEQQAVADLFKNNDPRWYHWRYENWGTKNDVFGVEVLSKDESADGTWSLTATFTTANGEPTQQWFRAFLKQYPRAQFRNIYVDEDCYSGVTVGKDGKTIDESRQDEEDWATWEEEQGEDSDVGRYDVLKAIQEELAEVLMKQIDERPNFTEFFKQKLAEKGVLQGD
jgi:hypothetical protein